MRGKRKRQCQLSAAPAQQRECEGASEGKSAREGRARTPHAAVVASWYWRDQRHASGARYTLKSTR